MLKRSRAAGDTIIEVLLAVTIFSLLAGVTLTLMNQSTNAAQRSVEITLVRQQIDAQADMLRALHESAAATNTAKSEETIWSAVSQRAQLAAAEHQSPYSGAECPDPNATDQAQRLSSRVFALADTKNSIRFLPMNSADSDWYKPASMDAGAPPYAQVSTTDDLASTSYGIWIEPFTEGIDPDANKVGAYIFRIRACWYSPGLDTPMQIETIVKLYDILNGEDFTGQDIIIPDETNDGTGGSTNPGDEEGSNTPITEAPPEVVYQKGSRLFRITFDNSPRCIDNDTRGMLHLRVDNNNRRIEVDNRGTTAVRQVNDEQILWPIRGGDAHDIERAAERGQDLYFMIECGDSVTKIGDINTSRFMVAE